MNTSNKKPIIIPLPIKYPTFEKIDHNAPIVASEKEIASKIFQTHNLIP